MLQKIKSIINTLKHNTRTWEEMKKNTVSRDSKISDIKTSNAEMFPYTTCPLVRGVNDRKVQMIVQV